MTQFEVSMAHGRRSPAGRVAARRRLLLPTTIAAKRDIFDSAATLAKLSGSAPFTRR
jgi:hypothetical protein